MRLGSHPSPHYGKPWIMHDCYRALTSCLCSWKWIMVFLNRERCVPTKISLGWNEVSWYHIKQTLAIFCWSDNAFSQYMSAIAAIALAIVACICELESLRGKYKNLNILRTKKSILDEIISIFHNFLSTIIWWKKEK